MSNKANEKLLSYFLEKADKKFAAIVGVTALGIQSLTMDSKEFKAFLTECINQAHDIQKSKMMGGDSPDLSGFNPDQAEQDQQAEPDADDQQAQPQQAQTQQPQAQ